MNYRHSYHAGSFTDVFKHIVLIGLLDALCKKEKPFVYLDTHAGAGYYDLFSSAPQKSKEYETGIAKITPEKNMPKLIQKYLSVIRQFNDSFSGASEAALRFYPGSPLIAQARMRELDRMILCELHPEELESLKSAFLNDDSLAIHHMDGYLALKAFLPPKERRGLILIDPPYEKPDEFKSIIRNVTLALKRFETGCYAIWYPIKNPKLIENFHHQLKQVIKKPVLILELTIYSTDVVTQLNGNGLAIINPPWQFENVMEETLPWLAQTLGMGEFGSFQNYLLK